MNRGVTCCDLRFLKDHLVVVLGIDCDGIHSTGTVEGDQEDKAEGLNNNPVRRR